MMGHCSGGQGVGGSNPLAPTILPNIAKHLGRSRLFARRKLVARSAGESRLTVQEPPQKSPHGVPRAFSRAQSAALEFRFNSFTDERAHPPLAYGSDYPGMRRGRQSQQKRLGFHALPADRRPTYAAGRSHDRPGAPIKDRRFNGLNRACPRDREPLSFQVRVPHMPMRAPLNPVSQISRDRALVEDGKAPLVPAPDRPACGSLRTCSGSSAVCGATPQRAPSRQQSSRAERALSGCLRPAWAASFSSRESSCGSLRPLAFNANVCKIH